MGIRKRDLPPETLRQVMAHAKPKRKAKKPIVFVEPVVCFHMNILYMKLPIETKSEINLRSWRCRAKRSKTARNVVGNYFPQDAATFFRLKWITGHGLRITLTRLGGRKLDRSNLPTALKATEDGVAEMIGANDGDERWQASWHQEPGGPVGVRIEVEVADGWE